MVQAQSPISPQRPTSRKDVLKLHTRAMIANDAAIGLEAAWTAIRDGTPASERLQCIVESRRLRDALLNLIASPSTAKHGFAPALPCGEVLTPALDDTLLCELLLDAMESDLGFVPAVAELFPPIVTTLLSV